MTRGFHHHKWWVPFPEIQKEMVTEDATKVHKMKYYGPLGFLASAIFCGIISREEVYSTSGS